MQILVCRENATTRFADEAVGRPFGDADIDNADSFVIIEPPS